MSKLPILVILLAATLATPASAADPDKARAALDKAELAMAAQDYRVAAEGMEEAYVHDPNPLWLANAGYAHMLAGQQDRAIEDLSRALADPQLAGLDRDKATDRLARASAARAHLARSDEAKARGDFEAAARAYDNAFQAAAVGPYLIEAGALWERAGNLDMAEARFTLAAKQVDLNPMQRRDVAEALSRIAKARIVLATMGPDSPDERTPSRPPPERGGNGVAGWVLVASGIAVTGLGVAGFVLSAADEAAWNDAPRAPDGAIVMSEAEARALEDSASTWLTVGVVSSIVGGAALVTGIVLLVSDDAGPDTRGSVHVGGAPLSGGGLITASGRF